MNGGAWKKNRAKFPSHRQNRDEAVTKPILSRLRWLVEPQKSPKPENSPADKPLQNPPFARPHQIRFARPSLLNLFHFSSISGLIFSFGMLEMKRFGFVTVIELRKMIGNRKMFRGNGKAFWAGFMPIAGAISALADD